MESKYDSLLCELREADSAARIADVEDLQTALDAKADADTVNTHLANIKNPHAVNKGQLGLDKVDNTSDTDKPVSSAQQAALDAKANTADLPDNLAELAAPSGLQCHINGQAIGMYACFSALVAYLQTLTLSEFEAVTINCSPGVYTETAAIAFPEVRVMIAANFSTFNFGGGIMFGSDFVRIDNANINGNVSIGKGFLENCFIVGNVAIANGDGVQLLHGHITGNVTVASGGWYIGSTEDIRGLVTSAGRVFMGGGCSLTANSDSPCLSSSAGYIQLSDCSVTNSGSGGCISCDNGATASAPNAISNVIMSGGTIEAGTAVTLVGPVYVTTAMSGSAIARLNVN